MVDHENLSITGKCSPRDAARLVGAVVSADEHQRAAFCAWIACCDYAQDTDGVPSASEFEERLCGSTARP